MVGRNYYRFICLDSYKGYKAIRYRLQIIMITIKNLQNSIGFALQIKHSWVKYELLLIEDRT
ncbi:MAG: hypothetical protein K0R08_2002 [Solimicrobium sp.]|jgi:hypothetical protein|nr:hypothetical protein [Solimicrobium sp.]